MPYVSPGAAFSASLEQSALERAVAQRQALLDAQNARRAQDEHEEAMNALQEKRTEATAKLEDKERAQIEREVTNMVPGDIPDTSLIARARKYHIPLPTTTDTPEGQAPVASAAPIRLVPAPGAPTPTPPAPEPQPIRFAGSPVDRRKALEDQKQADYIKTLPVDSPERKALEYEQMTGKPAPAGMFQKPVHSAAYNEYQDYVGSVPKGGKILTFEEYQNEDANRKAKVANTTATTAREDTRRDNNYKSAVTELEKAALPITAQIDTINSLGTMLSARTPQADALIAPMVLKATVSGAGSGFRMTQSEINQVIGGRSKWQDLEAKLNKWSTDPTQALSITDEQRTQLRDLAKAIRTKANAKMQKITKARHALDDADTVDTIHRTMTDLKDDLYLGESEPEPSNMTPADLIKKYGGAQ